LQEVAGAGNGRSHTAKVRGFVRTSGKIDFQIENPLTNTLSSLGLTNPLNVAWELVPFSFVVDWFIPIGDFFNGLIPPQGISNVSGSLTTKLRIFVDAEVFSEGRYRFPMSAQSAVKYRNPITEIPRYHLVGADINLSKNQIASGLSLLWSVGFGRKAEKSAYVDATRQYNAMARGSLSREKWNGSPFDQNYSHL
jgi:hypothetical protein